MSDSSHTVIKNVSSLMISQIVTWGLTLLLTIFLPRYLGPTGTGDFTIASSIWALVGVFIGFGMDLYLAREIARAPQLTGMLLGTSLLLRVLFYLVGIVLVTIYCLLMNFPPLLMAVVHIIGISFIFQQLANGVQAALQGLEVMHYISIANISSKATNTFFGIGVLVLGFGMLPLAICFVLGALVSFSVQLFSLIHTQKVRLVFAKNHVKALLIGSSPFVISTLVTIAYTEVDVLMFASLVPREQVGWYGVALQLFATFLFVPVVFMTAIYPGLSRSYLDSPDILKNSLRRGIDLMLLTSIPISFGLFVIAESLILLLFGEQFAPSATILHVLAFVLILMYFNVLLGYTFASINRQNIWTVCITVGLVGKVILNPLLVPWSQEVLGLGVLGGAISLLVSELGMVIAGAFLVPRGTLTWSTTWSAMRIIFAGLVMALVAWQMRHLFILVPIVIGALIYIGLIALLRVVPAEDIAVLKQFAKRIISRLRRQPTTTANV